VAQPNAVDEEWSFASGLRFGTEFSAMLRDILLVDDSHSDAILLTRALKRAGLEESVIHIHDPREALAYLRGEDRYSDRDRFPLPDILLLDLKMPEIDGFQMLRWARRQLPEQTTRI
jgi:CheY-like chemotaxis protein